MYHTERSKWADMFHFRSVAPFMFFDQFRLNFFSGISNKGSYVNNTHLMPAKSDIHC